MDGFSFTQSVIARIHAYTEELNAFIRDNNRSAVQGMNHKIQQLRADAVSKYMCPINECTRQQLRELLRRAEEFSAPVASASSSASGSASVSGSVPASVSSAPALVGSAPALVGSAPALVGSARATMAVVEDPEMAARDAEIALLKEELVKQEFERRRQALLAEKDAKIAALRAKLNAMAPASGSAPAPGSAPASGSASASVAYVASAPASVAVSHDYKMDRTIVEALRRSLSDRVLVYSHRVDTIIESKAYNSVDKMMNRLKVLEDDVVLHFDYSGNQGFPQYSEIRILCNRLTEFSKSRPGPKLP
jgi:hypothetical protein